MIEYTVKVYNQDRDWFFNGLRHREDGPAIERSNGHTEWFFNGNLHREDGPAIEYPISGIKEWYLNGQRHREDGPAFMRKDYVEYYLKGVFMSEEEHRRQTNPIKELTVAEVEKLLGYPVKIIK